MSSDYSLPMSPIIQREGVVLELLANLVNVESHAGAKRRDACYGLSVEERPRPSIEVGRFPEHVEVRLTALGESSKSCGVRQQPGMQVVEVHPHVLRVDL